MHLQRLSAWRDRDSNPGHHDFQKAPMACLQVRICRTSTGSARAGWPMQVAAVCARFQADWDGRSPFRPNHAARSRPTLMPPVRGSRASVMNLALGMWTTTRAQLSERVPARFAPLEIDFQARGRNFRASFQTSGVPMLRAGLVLGIRCEPATTDPGSVAASVTARRCDRQRRAKYDATRRGNLRPRRRGRADAT